ncbi:MAG: hypothetical protein H0T74_08810 [Rubrobacteraceae bacterium]|jgi:hypothetical protein|nr:hypothetical protein [Rubrobacteraceae bacterium]
MMGVRRPWLEALKESRGRSDEEQGTGDVIFSDAPGHHHAKHAKAPPDTNINTARATKRDPDERRLIAAGWVPKDRCGPLSLTIWQHPDTGFYSSREVALRRLDNPT